MEKYYLASSAILVVALLFVFFAGFYAKTGYYTKYPVAYFNREAWPESIQKNVEYTYRYGAAQGPQGQQPIRNTDQWFIPYKPPAVRPYISVCCNVIQMAENGQVRCPETRAQAIKSCAVNGEEGSYNFPNCPPNNLQCYLPFKDGKNNYEDEEIIE